MSDEETIVNTWSDPEITSGSETLSDAAIGDDERPARRKRASHVSFLPSSTSNSTFEKFVLTDSRSQKLKTHKISEQSGVLAQSGEAATQTSVEDSK
jgi:hypothetical protein